MNEIPNDPNLKEKPRYKERYRGTKDTVPNADSFNLLGERILRGEIVGVLLRPQGYHGIFEIS